MPVQKRYKRKALTVGQTADFARTGGRMPAVLPDVFLIAAPVTHTPETDYLNAGANAIEISGTSTLPLTQQAICAMANAVNNFCNSRGKDLDQLTLSECDQCADEVYPQIKKGIMANQMHEAAGRNPARILRYGSANSNRIEKRLAEKAEADGYYYFSDYDAAADPYLLQKTRDQNWSGLLANDAGILQLLRQGVSFGNTAFLPHAVAGEADCPGAAYYRHVLFSTYLQMAWSPNLCVTGTAFAARLCKRGLIALADTTGDNAVKAKILARKIMNFTWSAIWEQFNNGGNVVQTKVPGKSGYNQTYMLMNGSPAVQLGSLLAGLAETGWLYDWEDGRRYGWDPNVLYGYNGDGSPIGIGGTASQKTGFFNGNPGLPEGYIGPETPTGYSTHASGQYIPGFVAAYPQKAMGMHDLPFVTRQILSGLRGWVGVGTAGADLSVWGPGDTAFIDASNFRRYHYDRFVAGGTGRGWGVGWYNPTTRRGACLYFTFHKAPFERDGKPKVLIGGTEYTLTNPDGSDLSGGWAHPFLFQNDNNT